MSKGRISDVDTQCQFLSAIAALMTQKQDIKHFFTHDDLDVVASWLKNPQETSSFMMESDDHKTILLDKFDTIFGPNFFVLNLFRYTVLRAVSDLLVEFSDLVKHLGKKSQLFINRPTRWLAGTGVERETTLMFVCMEFLSQVTDLMETLQRDQESLANFFYPPEVLPDDGILKEVSENLGFKSFEPEVGWALRESKILSTIESTQRLFTETLEEFVGLLVLESDDFESNQNLLFVLATIKSQQFIQVSLKLSASRYRSLIESQRRAFAESMTRFSAEVRSVSEALQRTCSRVATSNLQPSLGLGASLENHLIRKLLAKGIDFKEARLAVSDLAAYIKAQAVMPEELLLGEMTKVSSHFDHQSLKEIQDWHADIYASRLGTQKNLYLNRWNSVCSRLDSIVGAMSRSVGLLAIFLVLVLSSVTSCGVKLPPKNPKEVVRPDVPFFAPAGIEASPSPLRPPPKNSNNIEGVE